MFANSDKNASKQKSSLSLVGKPYRVLIYIASRLARSPLLSAPLIPSSQSLGFCSDWDACRGSMNEESSMSPNTFLLQVMLLVWHLTLQLGHLVLVSIQNSGLRGLSKRGFLEGILKQAHTAKTVQETLLALEKAKAALLQWMKEEESRLPWNWRRPL